MNEEEKVYQASKKVNLVGLQLRNQLLSKENNRKTKLLDLPKGTPLFFLSTPKKTGNLEAGGQREYALGGQREYPVGAPKTCSYQGFPWFLLFFSFFL